MILLIVILMNVLSFFLVKQRGVLSCGITGYCGSKIVDKDKLKLVALYNEVRGTDGCGIFINGKVTRGWDGHKSKISDLMANTPFNTSKAWRNVVIHNRKSASFRTEDRTHPYEYQDEEGNKFWFVHNGTITNHYALASEYDIDPNDYTTDSHIIGAIIFKEGNAKVFSKYNGVGAFLFWDNINLNTLWAYRGEGGTEHERPLHYWQDGNGGMYISSLEEPLSIISDSKGVIEEFPGNTLCKIVDGEIVETFPINRTAELNSNVRATQSYVNRNNWTTTFNVLNVKEEEYLLKNYANGGRIYWRKGRFWRDGKVVHGKQKLTTKTGHFKAHNGEPISEYWFYRGVLCKDKERYDSIHEKMADLKGYNWDIRMFVAFPFCSSQYTITHDGKSSFYMDKNGTPDNVWYGCSDLVSDYDIPFCDDKPVTLRFRSIASSHGHQIDNNCTRTLFSIIEKRPTTPTTEAFPGVEDYYDIYDNDEDDFDDPVGGGRAVIHGFNRAIDLSPPSSRGLAIVRSEQTQQRGSTAFDNVVNPDSIFEPLRNAVNNLDTALLPQDSMMIRSLIGVASQNIRNMKNLFTAILKISQ